MKVAYLTNSLTYGGGTRSLFLLLKSLDPMPFEKKVLVSEHPTDSFERDFLKHCGSVDLIKNKPLGPGASWSTLCRRRMESPVPLLRSLSRWEPDIVHVNGVIYPHLLEEIKKQLHCTVIVHVREHRKQKGALWGGEPVGIMPLNKFIDGRTLLSLSAMWKLDILVVTQTSMSSRTHLIFQLLKNKGLESGKNSESQRKSF